MIEHEFVSKLADSKQYLRDACAKVIARNVTFDEFERAKLRLKIAENAFMYCNTEDIDSNALMYTIAEIELSKLLTAKKLYDLENLQ